MRILVGKTFGIGNACLCVPMVKAIASLGHDVDVLVGDGPDDFGAYEVFQELRRRGDEPVVNKIYRGCVPFAVQHHDVAIMAIPYDGRWRNGIDFFATDVMDCRKRPGDVERLGFDMWKKHEVEYMMENARQLGFKGETPDGSFLDRTDSVQTGDVYLGIGYKRDHGGFGRSKHFGNENYARLIDTVSGMRPQTRFISSGPMIDMLECSNRIMGLMHGSPWRYSHALTTPGSPGLHSSFKIISGCHAYVGNDTGMMHVAASMGIPTMGLFAYPDLIVKNPPFCTKSRALFFTSTDLPVDEIAQQFVDFVWG